MAEGEREIRDLLARGRSYAQAGDSRAASSFFAAAHVDALEKLIADPASSHIMNCGYGRGFSVLEVLDAVDRVTNMRIERRMEPRRAGDPDSLVADNGRILATLPWRPRLDDLDTIVAHALAWERKLAERG